jgi:hypothetical protein
MLGDEPNNRTKKIDGQFGPTAQERRSMAFANRFKWHQKIELAALAG